MCFSVWYLVLVEAVLVVIGVKQNVTFHSPMAERKSVGIGRMK
jgi:hypothetical protein